MDLSSSKELQRGFDQGYIKGMKSAYEIYVKSGSGVTKERSDK